MKMKRILSTLALTLVLSVALTSCATTSSTTTAAPAATTKAAADATTAAPADTTAKAEEIYIPVISKGLQYQFWQVVKKGSEDAAAKFGVTITFEGPASESEIAAQVTMLDSALAKKPQAICLAALSTDSVTDQLNKALAAGIPVIGFDSGVPALLKDQSMQMHQQITMLPANLLLQACSLLSKMQLLRQKSEVQ